MSKLQNLMQNHGFGRLIQNLRSIQTYLLFVDGLNYLWLLGIIFIYYICKAVFNNKGIKKRSRPAPIFKLKLKMTVRRPVFVPTAMRNYPKKPFFARNVGFP